MQNLDDVEVFIDKQKVEVSRDGELISVDALHKGWASNRLFVNYYPPPTFLSTSDGDVDIEFDLETWNRTAHLFIEDLEFLLRLPYHKFWSQIIYHRGVHGSLASYLKHAPRAFDIHSFDNNISECIRDIQSRIHRLTFLVFLRMSTHKESKSSKMTPSVYGNFIYDKFIFDIPKIMDLCAVYGNANKEVLVKMIGNIFNSQEAYLKDLELTVTYIIKVFSTIEENLGIKPNEKVDVPVRSESTSPKITENVEQIKSSKLEDVILYALDTFGTLYSFLEIYSPAAKLFFKNTNFLFKLTSLYDSIVNIVLPELNRRRKKEELIMESLTVVLNHTRTYILKIFHYILDQCVLQPVLEERGCNISEVCDKYLTLMSSILCERRFTADYNSFYPIIDDLDLFIQTGVQIDKERVDYVTNGLSDITQEYTLPGITNDIHIPKLETKEVEALSFSVAPDIDSECVGATAAVKDISEVELNSLISQVKDLLPDLGDGFVQECLNYYNFDYEMVLNAILEDSLPSCLNKLDRQKHSFTLPTLKIEQEHSSEKTLLEQRKNIFDNDEFDVFRRNDVDRSKVHKGKWKNQKAVNDQDVKSITLQLLEDFSNEDPSVNVYDDEYDDTYDEHAVPAFDEFLDRRPYETPRVLGGQIEKSESTTSEESENENENLPSVKRDEFVQNPAELREKAEQRYQEKMNRTKTFHNHNKDVKGGPKGQGQSGNVIKNRSNKEKNKSFVGNHNRKAMADRKRSRGMFPS